MTTELNIFPIELLKQSVLFNLWSDKWHLVESSPRCKNVGVAFLEIQMTNYKEISIKHGNIKVQIQKYK